MLCLRTVGVICQSEKKERWPQQIRTGNKMRNNKQLRRRTAFLILFDTMKKNDRRFSTKIKFRHANCFVTFLMTKDVITNKNLENNIVVMIFYLPKLVKKYLKMVINEDKKDGYFFFFEDVKILGTQVKNFPDISNLSLYLECRKSKR